MDHDFTTLSACKVGYIAHEILRKITRERPLIAEALWRETLIDAAVFREWIVNVGRRPATSRMAHFLAEIGKRLEAIGLANADQFELPMTQIDMADALGLSPVHVNRVIQELRRSGVLELRKHAVSIRDLPRLMQIADEMHRGFRAKCLRHRHVEGLGVRERRDAGVQLADQLFG